MMAGHKAVYDCVKAFSETDFTDDLKRIDVPTLILHGDDDQIVPIADSAMLSSKLVKGATQKVIPGAPHGMCSTMKDTINAERPARLPTDRPLLSWDSGLHGIEEGHRGTEEEAASDRPAEIQNAVVVPGRPADEHVLQHLLGGRGVRL